MWRRCVSLFQPSSEIHLSVCDRIHYKLKYKIDHKLYNLQDSSLRELLL